MKKLSFLFVLLFISLSAYAQGIEGHWKGKITQNEGGYRSEYVLELWMVQKGDSITGKSFVFVDDIYAEMDIFGTLTDDIFLKLNDKSIVSHEVLEGMEWCLKTYLLRVRRKGGTITIEGDWQGVTSFSSCIPGKISLVKKIPRA